MKTKCLYCENEFTGRSNKKYCSANCRKNASRGPQTSANSPTKKRENLASLDTAMRMAERLYTLPPSERLGYMKDLVDQARAGDVYLRRTFTNPMLLKGSERWLHWRLDFTYKTIAQAADAYCRKFWGAGVQDVVYGIVEEPATGEVLADGTVKDDPAYELQPTPKLNEPVFCYTEGCMGPHAWQAYSVAMNLQRPEVDAR